MIGDRIKDARLALGYSAEQVAAFLGISPATVYRYENGDISKLPSKFIKPLADYLCISPSYLMGWSDEPPEVPPDQQHTPEGIRILSGVDKMPPDQRARAEQLLQVAFAEYFKDERP